MPAFAGTAHRAGPGLSASAHARQMEAVAVAKPRIMRGVRGGIVPVVAALAKATSASSPSCSATGKFLAKLSGKSKNLLHR